MKRPESLERLRQLAAKVDAFFARVEARHGAAMECRSGCHDCCLPGLSCTGVEARALREALRGLPAEEQARLRARVAAPPADRCVPNPCSPSWTRFNARRSRRNREEEEEWFPGGCNPSLECILSRSRKDAA
jgi:hypothetical protein